MRLGVLTSRRSMMERERAMDAARNPGISRFGDCLVNNQSKGDKMLASHMRKINSEIRRMEAQINNKMKCFLKSSAVLNHDPLILVERPASPEAVKKAYVMRNDKDEHGYPANVDEEKPSYMRQLRSKARTPSTLTTIDAFTVKARKKKNVWDDATGEKPQFQSTVRPYAKLTKREITDLQKGYEFHKPKLDNNAHSDSEEKYHKALPSPKRSSSKGAYDSDASDVDDYATPFITQMAEMRKANSRERNEHTLAEISVHKRSPTQLSEGGGRDNAQGRQAKKNVRFRSPALSAPSNRGRAPSRRTKTKETAVVVIPQS